MKNYIRIVLDIVMTMLFILLMDLNTTGLFWHEYLGLYIFILFIIHKILNWKWIKSVTLSFSAKSLKPGVRFMYVLSILLFVFISMTVISGVLISENILTFITTGNIELWSALHTSFAYSSLILISVHLGLNWKPVMSVIRKALGAKSSGKLGKLILRAAALILVLFGIKNSFTNGIGGKILMPFTYTSRGYGVASADTTRTTELIDSDKLYSNMKLLSTGTSAENITLEDYLSGLYCTGCGKHCSLLSPRCGRGSEQAAIAEDNYNSMMEQLQEQNTEQSDVQNDVNQNSSNKNNADSGNNDTNSSQDGNITSESTRPESETGSIPGAVSEFLPIMSLYAAGTYYTVEFVNKKRKKK